MDCACGRRHLLLGSLATAFAGPAATTGTPGRIDVHHHIVPPAWLVALKQAKLDNPLLASWSAAKALEDMDEAGVATAITPVTTPQVGFLPPADAARVARESNEWARRLAGDHPGRFGMFAMLPMPHVAESLDEIEYACDTLKVDGIGVLTNYGDRWLTEDEFGPVLEELNRRKAVVYIHPSGVNCCAYVTGVAPYAASEYVAGTRRTIFNLVFNGASAIYGDVTFVFSHAGGNLMLLAGLLRDSMANASRDKERLTQAMVDHELTRFYYDTAQIWNRATIDALTPAVPVSQLLFGTDYPYRTCAEAIAELTERFSANDLAAIDRTNALRILPSWR